LKETGQDIDSWREITFKHCGLNILEESPMGVVDIGRLFARRGLGKIDICICMMVRGRKAPFRKWVAEGSAIYS
jgi:hypothetical protein